MGQIFRFCQYLGLRTFTNTGRAEQDDTDRNKTILSELEVNLDTHVISILRRCS